MAQDKKGSADVLAALFDNGAYTALFAAGDAAVKAACGMVGGQGVYAVCQMGGALGTADVKIARKTLKLAAKTGNPVVTFYNTQGALLAEGQQALLAAGKLAAAAAKISGVVPQISVVTGTCGASAALAAVGADLCVMAKGAELFLSPPFLSAAKGDKVEGAGSAEFAAKAGVAALVAEDAEDAARVAARLLALLPPNNLSQPAAFEYAAPTAKLNPAKYTGADATAALADEGSAIELYKGFGDGVVTSLATVNGAVAGIVATNGPDTYLGRYCSARTARFVRLCDAFSIPVVTILNTGGFSISSSSDAAGNIREAARLAGTYADATTAKVAVVAGQAYGSIYTALGSADLTIALEGSTLAPAAPSAVASVLYKQDIEAMEGSLEANTEAKAKAWAAEEAGAAASLKNGLADFVATPAALHGSVAAALDILATKRTQRLPKKHGNMAL